MSLTTIINKNTAQFHCDYETELKLYFYDDIHTTVHLFMGPHFHFWEVKHKW